MIEAQQAARLSIQAVILFGIPAVKDDLGSENFSEQGIIQQAVRALRAALPGQSWAQARALATHPRIAAAARKAGFGLVCESRPTLPDVLASLNSQHFKILP